MSSNMTDTTAALRSRTGSSFVLSAGVSANALPANAMPASAMPANGFGGSWPTGFAGAGVRVLGYPHVVSAVASAMEPATTVGADTRQTIAAKQARPPRGIPR